MSENLPDQLAKDDAPIARDVIKSHGGMWQPGQSGNPKGRPKGSKNHLSELKRELELAVRDGINPKVIRQIIESMAELAIAGDVKAAKLLLDKLVSNAGGGDEEQGTAPKIVFEIKNLTLKHPIEDAQVITVEAQEIVAVSTGAVLENQTQKQDSAGGNMVGGIKPVAPAKVPAFMGEAGQADNRETNRGPGGK